MASNPLVYLDIEIDEEKIGRIVIELFRNEAPQSTENFLHLCEGDILKDLTRSGNGKRLSLENNFFHRIIKNFMVQAGDIVFGSDKFIKSSDIGRGGCSIYATDEELQKLDTPLPCYGIFQDENLGEFDVPFLVAMANSGTPNTNSSQFFITTSSAPHLNKKHSIFGRVTEGKSVVRTIENIKVDDDGFPASCVRISACGNWEPEMGVPVYNASNSKVGGDIYEEYPEDDTNFNQDNFQEAFKATDTIKCSGSLLFKEKNYQEAYFKYRKALRYANEFIPEKEMDEENNLKFQGLKVKLFLNLSLTLYRLRRYKESANYAGYVLDAPSITKTDAAKAYYRRATAYIELKRLDDALADFKLCEENNPSDKVVQEKIQYVNNLLQQKKEKTKRSIAKFFA